MFDICLIFINRFLQRDWRTIRSENVLLYRILVPSMLLGVSLSKWGQASLLVGLYLLLRERKVFILIWFLLLLELELLFFLVYISKDCDFPSVQDSSDLPELHHLSDHTVLLSNFSEGIFWVNFWSLDSVVTFVALLPVAFWNTRNFSVVEHPPAPWVEANGFWFERFSIRKEFLKEYPLLKRLQGHP